MTILAPATASSHAFVHTSWTLVRNASGNRTALGEWCNVYWYPIYAFLRRQGNDRPTAEDLTQGFIAHVIESDVLKKADPNRGTFRNFLLGCCDNYASKEYRKATTKRRGGHRTVDSLDVSEGEGRYLAQQVTPLTAEAAFDRDVATALVQTALIHLGDEYANHKHAECFVRLKDHLVGGPSEGYESVAKELGYTAENLRKIASRMRIRLGQILLETAVRSTGRTPQQVQDDFRDLIATLGLDDRIQDC